MKAKRVLLECRLTRERERLGLSTFGQYLDMIESEQNTTARTQFINLVTTHYTYFMRESSQFSFIRDTVLPELLARRSHRPWRFLCAGCSTGDECYSLSIKQ
ncbi:CheR family methyltransferase [Eggerthella sp. YY7918]|uniref:CheR family methyltransferase n=1 Tax=Eggerthella sp. (strain YY7918) TaxID=502558 RepID=UPI001E412BAF|nr:CheR family methyltransferase [Eggerthella sp. YY7918]